MSRRDHSEPARATAQPPLDAEAFSRAALSIRDDIEARNSARASMIANLIAEGYTAEQARYVVDELGL